MPGWLREGINPSPTKDREFGCHPVSVFSTGSQKIATCNAVNFNTKTDLPYLK
jgi:hypothetical protein